MKLKLNISLFFLLTFTMPTVFAMTFTATQAGGNSSKDLTVQAGKQYQLKFDLQHQTTNSIRVQILEGLVMLVDESNLIDGFHIYAFTPTSNVITLKFIREDNDNISRDFQVDNLVYEEVSSALLPDLSNHIVGQKEYELTDHLDNIRALISDKKVNGNTNVVSAIDYLPFGMTARSYSNGTKSRYGYNGKEKENEISDSDYDYSARLYNSKLGKWFSVDPLFTEYASYSSYSACNNSPMFLVDPTGKGAEISNVVIDQTKGSGTANMTFHVYLYADPNAAAGTISDPATNLKNQLGEANKDGTWTINVGTGLMQAKMASTDGASSTTVALNVTATIVVHVISAEEAKLKIEAETDQSNNYYRIINESGTGGHNMAGSNQGVILEGTMIGTDFTKKITHELWHSVANGYPGEDFTAKDLQGNPNLGYGLHNELDPLSIMNVPSGESIQQSDFNAIKPNWTYSSQTTQCPIAVGSDGSTVVNGEQLGGAVNNASDLTNDQLNEKK